MPKIALAGVTLLPEGIEAALEFAIENEYPAMEVYGDFPQAHSDDVDAPLREKLRRMVEDSGISLSVHAPWIDLNIASFNRGARVESVRQHLDAMEMATHLGANKVVIHAGDFGGGGELGREICFNHSLDSIKEIAEHAARVDMPLCLENVIFLPSAVDKSYDDLLKIKEQVAYPLLKFTFDIGHARLGGGIEEGLKALSPDISHVHFSDNFGERDDHLIIGRGDADFSPCRDFLRSFEGDIVLEVMGMVEDGRARSLECRENVRQLLGEPSL